MTTNGNKTWFVVTDRNSRHGIYRICFVETAEKAMEKAGATFQEPKAMRMTWRGLRALTNCVIPTFDPIDAIANKPLIFNTHGRTVVVYG